MTKNSLSLCFKTGKYTIYVKHTFFEDKEAGIYVGKLEERLQEIIGLKIQIEPLRLYLPRG